MNKNSENELRASFQQVRTGFWHLRHGGITQFRIWQDRQKALSLVPKSLPVEGEETNEKREAKKIVAKSDPIQDLFVKYPIFMPVNRPAPYQHLKVAVILDDFSAQAWGYEWDSIFVTPENWYESLNSSTPDLLFVESAWAGNGKSWQYHLTGPTAPRPALIELVTWCKEKGIPTVFWNKEDPPHYEDFLETARLFDWVLTSDSNKIPAYKDDLGHNNIDSLSFAAQPAIHNPTRPKSGFQERGVAFAGMYFTHKFAERRAQMDYLLPAAIEATKGTTSRLDIFSRQLNGDKKYQFPSEYSKNIVGSLPYERMLSAHKSYKVFLNVNSVVDSPSMCARRIFEITASGVPVISAPSEAISNFFTAEAVPQVANQKEATAAIRAMVRSKELRDRTVHLAQRDIWANHTYEHRVSQIVKMLGIQKSVHLENRDAHQVSALVSTNRPGQIDFILETMSRQVNVDLELVLLTHGFKLNSRSFMRKAKKYGLENVVLLSEESTTVLGDCLNRTVEAASGRIVTKMDDDDLYGDHYLQDQCAALSFSGAEVVGKLASYMHLGARNVTLLRFGDREHQFTDLVMGPTIMTYRQALLENPFASVPRGEDSRLLKDVLANGGKIYASDRFNFVQMRSGTGTQHTWNIDEAELMSMGVVESYGLNRDHLLF